MDHSFLLGKPVETISVSPPPSESYAITSFSIIPHLGASTLSIGATAHGKSLSLFPDLNGEEFTRDFQKDSNVIFQKICTPLFPMSNRLRPSHKILPLQRGENFTASVKGIEVKAKANHQGSKPDAPLHHLHGIAYLSAATRVKKTENSITTEHEHVLGDSWSGDVMLTIQQSIEHGKYIYRAECINTGNSPVPVGFGTHPYFVLPSGNPKNARLRVPATQVAEVDDFDNVFPTGKFKEAKNLGVNFNDGAVLDQYLDHYFLLDPSQKKEIQLVDVESQVRFRLTALTPNIIGAQIYYPDKGSVIAIEFVTHHPDPRESLWNQETGMQLLAPGERAEFAYQIEVATL